MLNEHIQQLTKVNKKLAALKLEQERLTGEIINELGHKYEGQKTYDVDKWRVEVKTNVIYVLDKKLYQQYKELLPAAYNPVKETISYQVEKAKCEEALNIAPANVTDMLINMICKKPAKPSVTIKDRI